MPGVPGALLRKGRIRGVCGEDYSPGVRPVIGMPTCLDDRGRWRSGRRYHYVDASYASALGIAGALPLYLPLSSDPAPLIQKIDALLLPGGDDIPPPVPYPAHVRFDPAPEDQLAFDRALLDAALTRNLPVLGICYGAQLLVLREAGALHYDIANDVPAAAPHKLDESCGRHAISVEPGTRLASVLGQPLDPVNSVHHQGIANAGPSLRVAARAPDGTIEAVEAPGPVFTLGVQWHPEKLAGSHRELLFRAFVSAAEGYRQEGR